MDISATTRLRLIIADDHLIMRQGIEMLLKSNASIRCVATASNGDEVLPLLEQHKADALLIDLSMPGKPTLEILSQCREMYPRLRLIVLTMHTTPLTIAEVFRAGAHGFVTKQEASEVLLETIRQVMSGEERVGSVLLEDVKEKSPLLTPREMEVLHEIARGMSTKEIADHLNLSGKTIELYRTQLLRKFKLTKATELVRLALESGILPQAEE